MSSRCKQVWGVHGFFVDNLGFGFNDAMTRASATLSLREIVHILEFHIGLPYLGGPGQRSLWV